MRPREVLDEWVKRFNLQDVEGLANLYSDDAVNHQVVMDPLNGREAIKRMFEVEFGRAKMVCEVENIFEDGDWAIMEWTDPLGLRGCGFFRVENDQIVLQRGYFDQLSFFKVQNLPIPDSYLNS